MHGPLRMVVGSNGKTLDAVSLVRGLQQYMYVYCKTACTVLRPFTKSQKLGCTQTVCWHFWWRKLCHEDSRGMWTAAAYFGLKAASHAAHKIRIVLCVSYCAAIFHIVKPKIHCMIKHLGDKIIYFWEHFLIYYVVCSAPVTGTSWGGHQRGSERGNRGWHLHTRAEPTSVQILWGTGHFLTYLFSV